MTTFFGIMTIGANPIQLPAPTLDGKVCKLLVQHAPGNTGNFKVGRIPNLTNDNATPGIFVASSAQTNADGTNQPGGTWAIETEKNEIIISEYRFHGTHAGDLLMWEANVKV